MSKKNKFIDKWDIVLFFSFLFSLALIIVAPSYPDSRFWMIVDRASGVFFGSIIGALFTKKVINRALRNGKK